MYVTKSISKNKCVHACISIFQCHIWPNFEHQLCKLILHRIKSGCLYISARGEAFGPDKSPANANEAQVFVLRFTPSLFSQHVYWRSDPKQKPHRTACSRRRDNTSFRCQRNYKMRLLCTYLEPDRQLLEYFFEYITLKKDLEVKRTGFGGPAELFRLVPCRWCMFSQIQRYVLMHGSVCRHVERTGLRGVRSIYRTHRLEAFH